MLLTVVNGTTQNYGPNFTIFGEEVIPLTQMECHYMFVLPELAVTYARVYM